MTDQTPELTFGRLVFSLMHTAAVHLGDAADPSTGQTGPANLEGARQMIDILGLLEEKTRGNLSAEEPPADRARPLRAAAPVRRSADRAVHASSSVTNPPNRPNPSNPPNPV